MIKIIDANMIAKGGEAVVYRIEHTGAEEIVAKCPLFKEEILKEDLLSAYDSIFYET